MKTIFFRMLEAEDKAAVLRAAIQESEAARGKLRFDVDPVTFSAVPHSPFAYWISDRLRELFKLLPRFASEERTARVGLQSNDDFRWLRAWWESAPGKVGAAYVVPLAKGGANSPFYADLHTGIRWGADGKWIKAWKADQLSQGLITANNSKCWNESHYFRPGLTWPHRSATFAAAALPAGCVFGQSGKTAFAPESQLNTLLGLFNSALMTLLARVQSDAVRIKFEVGLVQNTPLSPKLFEDSRIAILARRGWSLRRSLDTRNETSHAFTLPSLLQVEGSTLAERVAAWAHRVRTIETELSAIQVELDARCFDAYSIPEADRRPIATPLTAGTDCSDEPAETDDADVEPDSNLNDEPAADAASLAAELVSWAVGVAFGRFDVRLASGVRPLPPEPDPFDPLPSRSPGMYPERDEPADRPDILVDDEGHVDDLAARVRVIAEAVHVDPPDSLRAWVAKEFFQLHIKMYSKSRRKAPIYWQLSTPSASYSAWLYIHAFSKDTLFRVQNDYAAPKLAHEERRLQSLTSELREGATAAERKALAAQEAFVEELRAFLEEVKRVAPLWNPNLDDGVIINFAPLWRLVPQHKTWQKELKSTWDALCDGKYDWAHLAMHLWPERVVSKCAKDRSLAIAHGLEDVFWVQGTDGRWTARKSPTRTVDELVRERSSPAVKSALRSLLDAPAVLGNGGRRNGGRRRRGSGAPQREYV